MRGIRFIDVMMCCSVLLAACSGNYSSSAAMGTGGGSPSDGKGDGPTSPITHPKDYFVAQVQPNIQVCRSCHLAAGLANSPEQPNRRFVLADDPAQDYDAMFAAWTALGKGVDDNLLLQKPSQQVTHPGGLQWPKDSAAYLAVRRLLSCWDNPASCVLSPGGGDGGGTTTPLALLGNPGKHYFVSQICDNGKKPTDDDFYTDSTPIDWSQDPRRLLQQSGGLIDSDQYAVHFNDPFELCHTDTLFKNQAAQNALRKAKGQSEIYTAKPYAQTCGEWRARVQEGHDWIAMWPTDTSCGKEGLPSCGVQGSSIVGFISGSSDSKTWNNLWKVWGLSARPANFDEQVAQRYGHSTSPKIGDWQNPYPLPGEEGKLSKTFGGSGHLPLGWAQGRDANGNYTGKLALNCFSCHAGQIGAGEVAGRDGLGAANASSYGQNPSGSFMGLPNTNTELGVLLADLINAQQYDEGGLGTLTNNNPVKIPAVGYIPLVNTTRGTNAADVEIEAIVAVRDFDTLNFQHAFLDPAHPSTGDEDPPAWWWLHNKTRYLWFGGHSTDSSRGNMYFGSVNGLSGDQVKQNEAIFESVHDWSLTVEAPDYPQGYCTGSDDKPGCINRSLAEAGAILFHEKNLWADGKNSDIPKPKGNGACAGCHGAYAPRYANDKRFLPDPKLIGMTGYTVPIEIINTDPAQAEGWTKEMRPHVSTMWWSYPDAMEGYKFPENKDPLTELLDDYAITDGLTGANLADHLSRQSNRTGTFQPLSDALAQGLQQLSPIPGLPLGEQMGRIKGACGFEEKTVGYVTPPLHGVWASAPYFHNGSVPTVWEVLKPSDRKPVWRRLSKTTPDVTVNAYAHALSGTDAAYDFAHLGWKYDELKCGTGPQGIPYYTCQPDTPLPPEVTWMKDTLNGGATWPMWLVPLPVGASGMEDRKIFNTNLYSKKNRGHDYTKVLTDDERRALIEYLKTL